MISPGVGRAEREASRPDDYPPIKEALELVYGGWDRVRLPASFVAGGTILQGCLPLLMEKVSSEYLIQHVGVEKYERMRSLYQRSSLLNLWFGRELKQVLEALTAANIPVMILKGADLANSLYLRSELRHFDDMDLMVHAEDLPATLSIMEELGYSYHQEYRFEAISRQRAAFVYAKKGPVGFTAFEIHTAVHSNEMGVSVIPARLWDRARHITIAEKRIYGMGLEDLLVYLCWHYRSHAFERLIWLYDIAIVLSRCADQLDWEMIGKTAREWRLASTVCYCIELCKQLFHVSPPQRAQLDLLTPSRTIRRLIAHYVGEDLTQVLRQSAQRERKLLQRLMVDNIFALCLILLRIVFPSRTHIGRLYMEHSRLPVQLFWLYYFVHPLVIVKAYFKKSS